MRKLLKKKRALQRIVGTKERPRLAVFRSNKHIYAQLIDDSVGHTMLSNSTLNKKFCATKKTFAAKQAAFHVGEGLALKALAAGVKAVIFDRGKHLYHGRVESLAKGARNKGLLF